MVKMPTRAEIEQRYKSAIPQVPARYKQGVEKTTDWKTAAIQGQACMSRGCRTPTY